LTNEQASVNGPVKIIFQIIKWTLNIYL
jgi:hypothetical protein